MAAGIWAVIAFMTGELTTSDEPAVLFGLLISLMPAAAVAAKALKPSADVDLVKAAGSLAEAVEASELAQRMQLLAGDNQPIDVGFTFRAAPSRDAAGAGPAGRLSEIGEYYRRLRPGRLLVTGAPGAGKTVLAIELILSLLEVRQVDEPVPVRMSLAGWDTTRPLNTWLAEELADAYQVTRTTAKRMIGRGCVLPVLDGLDEMDADVGNMGGCRAVAALAALNQSSAGRQKAPLVVICRTSTYDILATRARLLDAARIDLSAVTSEQAQSFVAARALRPQQWQPVVDDAQRNPQGPAAYVMSTPWLLTLAMTVYEAEGDPAEILHFSEPEALRSHLLDRFVPAATELHRRAGHRVYRPEQITRWLGLFARYLTDNARAPRTVDGHVLPSTDLVLHRLWPLAGKRARAADIAITCIVGLAILLPGAPSTIVHIAETLPFAVLALLVIGWIFASARIAWPAPKGISPSRLLTLEGWRAVIGPVTFAVACALTLSLATILSIVVTLGPEFFIVQTTVSYLTLWGTIALAGGLAFGLRRNLETTETSKGPNSLVRVDLRSGILIGFSAGATAALAGEIYSSLTEPGPTEPWSYGLVGWIVGAVLALGALSAVGGIVWAAAWRRYFATLLCMRPRLPWRLGRFLAWAYETGMLRVAGNAYQFRHREFQEHLAGTDASQEHPQRRPQDR
ncbi:NACHT domain-containing protein [Streptomyces sp. NPDC101206]|uniref:NACHT domain-containing protein n=1 Tax=Streptomyces sp. NPDC101206 TaxID=3366128 RepID=UPI0037F319F0